MTKKENRPNIEKEKNRTKEKRDTKKKREERLISPRTQQNTRKGRRRAE